MKQQQSVVTQPTMSRIRSSAIAGRGPLMLLLLSWLQLLVEIDSPQQRQLRRRTLLVPESG